MKTLLKSLLYSTALVTLATGLNVLLGGALAVPGASGPVDASIDNEIRFFSVYWVGFGVLSFWVGRNLDTQSFFIPYIAAFFLLGGIARAASYLMVGKPSDILLYAMIVEFAIPFIMYLAYRSMDKPLFKRVTD